MNIDRSLTFKLTAAVFAFALFLSDLRGYSSIALARSISLEQKRDPERSETKQFEGDGQTSSEQRIYGSSYCHPPVLVMPPPCEGSEEIWNRRTNDDLEDELENSADDELENELNNSDDDDSDSEYEQDYSTDDDLEE